MTDVCRGSLWHKLLHSMTIVGLKPQVNRNSSFHSKYDIFCYAKASYNQILRFRMGLGEHVNRVPTVESNTIIGLLDYGIWPESGQNQKALVIWVLSLHPRSGKEYVTVVPILHATKTIGHGTHTASTTGGNQVNHVSLFNGLAEGNARGAVPLTRIAVYKACWLGSCISDAIMAAFDDAISDGIDIG
ncbi:hypothetical protein Sjap_012734 [Stephania japonica]|uniref:Uncharacterized protein n=1 Tax=Stephania japonica TaxID=461633 RepID=A0AAP0IWG2_9MAGN